MLNINMMVLSILLATLQWHHPVSAVSPRLENKPLIFAQQGFSMSQQTLERWSNTSMMLGQFEERDLFARQGCSLSGYGEYFFWIAELLYLFLANNFGLTGCFSTLSTGDTLLSRW